MCVSVYFGYSVSAGCTILSRCIQSFYGNHIATGVRALLPLHRLPGIQKLIASLLPSDGKARAAPVFPLSNISILISCSISCSKFPTGQGRPLREDKFSAGNLRGAKGNGCQK